MWGEVRDYKSSHPKFAFAGEQLLDENPLGDRIVGDVYLESLGNGSWRVWTSATVDESDQGPFRSLIYSPGLFEVDSSKGGTFSARRYHDSWMIDGSKVEGIAAPPERIPSSVLAIGTDDEKYGGVWRPLLLAP
jgi:hypothetical protein